MNEPPYSGRLTRHSNDSTFYTGATIMGVLLMVCIFMTEVGLI